MAKLLNRVVPVFIFYRTMVIVCRLPPTLNSYKLGIRSAFQFSTQMRNIFQPIDLGSEDSFCNYDIIQIRL